jgi:hypothetical protein
MEAMPHGRRVPYSLVPPTPSAKASLHYICRLSTTEGPLASEFNIGRCLHRHIGQSSIFVR